jgi:hypothetical protein
MKKSQLIQLIREVLNEYESNEIIPGISKNDEGEYNVASGMALDYYEKFVKRSTTIGTLVSALRSKLKAYGKELPDSELIKLAYTIEEKGKKSNRFSSSSNRFKNKRY